MFISTCMRALSGAALAAALLPALAAAGHAAAVKRPFSLPPSADLSYSIKARQHGLSLNGDSLTTWRAGDGKYAFASETRAALFGKILENKSEGGIDEYGLAPALSYEKRFRKEPSSTTFKRDGKVIVFGDSDESYPIKGGEQDRNSAPWQLLALARGAPDKFTPGSEWTFFVAGRRDAEPWVFKVLKQESVHTGEGEVNAVHLVKAPPPDAQGQQVDLWLAPSLDWYPVRLRFADSDGDYVEQTLEKISKK
ncbi:MAG TPA: DUF3108 domain-containing protein [Janthinobacterium sp.]|nr:DUF3108 domain-containing protein [Janthinobacterium sp.]